MFEPKTTHHKVYYNSIWYDSQVRIRVLSNNKQNPHFSVKFYSSPKKEFLIDHKMETCKK